MLNNDSAFTHQILKDSVKVQNSLLLEDDDTSQVLALPCRCSSLWLSEHYINSDLHLHKEP